MNNSFFFCPLPVRTGYGFTPQTLEMPPLHVHTPFCAYAIPLPNVFPCLLWNLPSTWLRHLWTNSKGCTYLFLELYQSCNTAESRELGSRSIVLFLRCSTSRMLFPNYMHLALPVFNYTAKTETQSKISKLHRGGS